MSKATLLPWEDLTDNTGVFSGYSVTADGEMIDTSDCPFLSLYETQKPTEKLYKIYNDGGHYIATPYFHSYGKRPSDKTPLEKIFDELYYAALQRQRKWENNNGRPRGVFNANYFVKKYLKLLRARFPSHGLSERRVRQMIKAKRDMFKAEKKTVKANARDLAFDSLYLYALRAGMKDEELTEHIKTGLLKLFADTPDLDKYIAEKIEKKDRNFYSRVKRFRRKANLNRWNYFVTFTYDDRKHTAETFRKKLRKCLSNLHTRRGWRYMGVFELAPETGRLHFHGLLYIPNGEMIGNIEEIQDYSKAQGKVQIIHSNTFFADSFGRNDFKELSMIDMKRGRTLEYILKYIGKTGERIVYSRGIPSQISKSLDDEELVAKMQDFVMKFVLFDDTIDYERDVMHYTKRKQISIIDILCNPPRTA